MKKILTAALMAGTLTTMAMAEQSPQLRLGVGLVHFDSNSDVKDIDSTTIYNIAFGKTTHLHWLPENMTMGFFYDMDYAKPTVKSSDGHKDSTLLTLGIELQLGYDISNDLNVYALATPKYGLFKSKGGGGYGIGAGLEYRLTDKIGLGIKYDINKVYIDYSPDAKLKYDTLKGTFSYRF